MMTESQSATAPRPKKTDSWRDPPPTMHVNRASKPWLSMSRRVSSRWASGTGDHDRVDVGDDAGLLEHVDEQRLAAEQQELLGERAPDPLADAAGEHDHADLHADLRCASADSR